MKTLIVLSLLTLGACGATEKIVGMPASALEADCVLIVHDSNGIGLVVGEPGDDLCHAMHELAEAQF